MRPITRAVLENTFRKVNTVTNELINCSEVPAQVIDAYMLANILFREFLIDSSRTSEGRSTQRAALMRLSDKFKSCADDPNLNKDAQIIAQCATDTIDLILT